MAFLSTLQLANPRGLRARAGLLREHRAGFDALFEVAATAMERLETPRDRVSLYDKKYTVVFGDDHWKSGDVLRYGEPWRKLDGDPALFDFARDAESAQRHALAISIAGTPARLFGRVEDLRKAEGSSPALEGAAQQLVRVAKTFDELVEKHGYRGAAGEQTGVLIRSRSSNGKWELEQSQFGGVRVTVRESGRVVERTGDGALLAAAQDFEQARDLCRQFLERDGDQRRIVDVAPGVQKDGQASRDEANEAWTGFVARHGLKAVESGNEALLLVEHARELVDRANGSGQAENIELTQLNVRSQVARAAELAVAGNSYIKEIAGSDPELSDAIARAVARQQDPQGAGSSRFFEGSTAPISGLSEQRSGAMAATDTAEGEKTKKPREKAADKYASMSPAELKAAWENIIDSTTTKRDSQGQPKMKDGVVERFPSFQFHVRLGEAKTLAGQNHDAPDLKISEPLLSTLKTFSGAIRQPEFSGEKGSRGPTGVVHSGHAGVVHLADNFGDEKAGEKAYRSRAVHLDTEALKKQITGLKGVDKIRETFETFRAAQRDSIQRVQARNRAIQFTRGQAKSAGGAELGA